MTPRTPAARAPWRLPTPVAAKVPAVTAAFWLVKVLTTGMGEAASDGLAQVSLALGGVVSVGGLAVALGLQLRARRYWAPLYWSAVSMVAVAGTVVADVLHKILGLSYAVTSAGSALAVAALFAVWHRTEGTLSVHSITTTRRELFYWTTVLATFALGTAVGDLVGLSLHLGFLAAGVLFLLAIAVPLLLWQLGASPVATFWAAYVLTRPLGASFADWLGKPAAVGGGLGHGDGPVALVLLAGIALLVAVLSVTGADVQRPVSVVHPPRGLAPERAA